MMEGFCRGCLRKFSEPTDLHQYCERNRRLFVYSTGLQVKRNDSFTFQLCKECYLNMNFSCKFKKQCRSTDKKFKNYLALKEGGDAVDLCTYLKNVEDTLTLRLPTASGSSTPAHQKHRDDDNESTCTSIRNFMTDILQGEEMPATEARIIREVIEEEADILDDSLDSHWLQDDISIDTEFGMDFNFSAFSTPRSINNDHCYTPRKFTNEREQDLNYYTSKEIIERSDDTKIPQANDMPILDDCDIEFENSVVNNIAISDLESRFCIDSTKTPDKDVINPKLQDNHSFIANNETKISTKNNAFAKLANFNDELFPANTEISPFENNLDTYVLRNKELSTDFIAPTANEGDITIILNEGIADKRINKSPLTREIDYYINNAELKKSTNVKIMNDIMSKVKDNENNKIKDHSPFNQELEQYIKGKPGKAINGDAKSNIDDLLNSYKDSLDSLKSEQIKNNDTIKELELEHYISKVESKKKRNREHKVNEKYEAKCTIDRNLEIALKNEDNKEFSLDQLLLSPQVSIQSGASTPTIKNILFGSMTPNNKNITTGLNFEQINGDINPTDDVQKQIEDNNCNLETKSDEISNNKVKNKPIKGKDIRKLKELCKFDHNESEIDESDENNESNHCTDTEINIEGKEIANEFVLKMEEVEDLDISVSNLLDIGDNEIDLNISIASDFLQDEDNNTESIKTKPAEDLFKRPFSPPDNKYDLEKGCCKICNKKFVSSKALRIHFAKTHKVKLQSAVKQKKLAVPKICELCGKSYRDASNFDRHKRAHQESEERYECKFCTLKFPTKARLGLHLRAHKGELSREDKNKQNSKYVCSTCGKVSTTPGNFKVHLMRHTKSYIVSCRVCQQGFYRMSDLTVHMRNHTGECPFVCQYCPKAYKRSYLLLRHVLQHMDKFRFQCDICKAKFVTKTQMRQHIKNKTCIKKRDELAEKMNERANNDVSVYNVVGSTEKIKEIMDTANKMPKESTTVVGSEEIVEENT